MKRLILIIIGIEESKESQLIRPANIFTKVIEENFLNLKKKMPINIPESYRTTNRCDHKRHFSSHIIIKTPNAQKKMKEYSKW